MQRVGSFTGSGVNVDILSVGPSGFVILPASDVKVLGNWVMLGEKHEKRFIHM